MDDLDILARDFGFRPQGKSAPMRSEGGDRRARASSPFVDDQNHNRDSVLFNDVFGGPPKYAANNSGKHSSMGEFDYDSVFKSSATTNDSKNKATSSLPVYDKPVYDEDIFDGLPGLKSKTTPVTKYDDDAFASVGSAQKQSDHFDDLLGNLGRNEKVELPKESSSSRGFDDLLPGFGSGNLAKSSRPNMESSQPPNMTGNLNQAPSSMMDDPFVVLESGSTPGVMPLGPFVDPLEEIGKLSKSRSATVDSSSAKGGGLFDDVDPLNGFGRSVPAFSSRREEGSPTRGRSSVTGATSSASNETLRKSSFRYTESFSQKKVPLDDAEESHQTIFDMPATSAGSQKSFNQPVSSPPYNAVNSEVDSSPPSEEHVRPSDEVWLTVSEIPLFTQPTSAPPPSRPPPPIPRQASRRERGSSTSQAIKKGNEFSYSPSYTHESQSPKHVRSAPKSPVISPIDELEDFAMGGTWNNVDESADIHSGSEMDTNSAAAASAAAMKEAMDRAEAKFRHAKVVREREHAKASRSKETVQLDEDEQILQDENQERREREKQVREREEQEREQKRLEKERERAREVERERGRQAVERATREARQRAAAEARAKAERAAVDKANAEARERAERAAVQRAQAEARERAAAEARARAEKAAGEARERANAAEREKAAVARAEAEVRRRAERAAVERAAAEARERAAAAARVNQQKNDNDLESFFGMGSRPSSAPRPRANSSDPWLDPQFQSKGASEETRRTSASGGASSNMRKASSSTNIVDDLSSIFGAAPAGEFQEVEGETEERRRARLERQQRTQERAAKALAEKNERDLQSQRDQEERHRIAETLDIEIKRWAAGKEGNLRALLSTLQYVLWQESGWQPVSLTDLITGASVKKVYRKATLCIHPDKVQQKGANLQQKYIAEKVFDLLKEAWNKFNSEELF